MNYCRPSEEEMLASAIGNLNAFAAMLRTKRKNDFIFKVANKNKTYWIAELDALSMSLQMNYYRVSDNN